MAREIFVDASAWIALANDRDRFHEAAKAIYPRLLREYGRLVTTNLVVAEVYVVLRKGLGHRAAISFLENLRQSLRILKICSTPELEREAEKLLQQYADQDFSYTDAVSFVLMRERGLHEAFAFDQHFATVGFVVLPGEVG
ncbi:MAG: type II toxin-antitoxin system VapC family toxin [Anaerolineae bacterium]|nr:type II toxin-antitoxin system VapC family toxin [Anaerolineae bacterium]